MLSEVGNILLILSGLVAVYSIICYSIGLRKNRADFTSSGLRGVVSIFFLITVSSIILFILLITKDFSNIYVASYTSRDLPIYYTISAFWAGQDGSLFLWLWTLSIFSFVVVLKKKLDSLTSYASVVILFIELFLIILILFLSNPFKRFTSIPIDGSGLNPLLQNIYMISHPPTIFIGYAGFTIPFAYAVASLLKKDKYAKWIKECRIWAVFSWFFLGLGILLGAKWAYVVLGWGGYWAWDPVENAALIPWLFATAFIHSIMMEERRGMFKTWNKVLILFVFELCIFGTFITRSNILSSVHSFAESNIGIYLLLFIILSIIAYIILLFLRLHLLRDESRLESLFSKEGFFVFNNFILVAAACIVLFGTLFPIISGFFGKTKISLGPSFYNQALSPLALALLLLTGLCSIYPWKKVSAKISFKKIAPPLIISLILLVTLVVRGMRNAGAIIAFTVSCFIIVSVLIELGKIKGILRNRRKYGGYIVHLGIALMCIGITGSSIFKTEKNTVLKMGETIKMGRYNIQYKNIEEEESENRYKLSLILDIKRDGRSITELKPAKLLYPNSEETYTEIAVLSTWREDLYIIFAGLTEKVSSSLQIHLNPLIFWLWFGGYLFFIGSIIAMIPHKKRKEISEVDEEIEELIRKERDSKTRKKRK